MGIEVFDGCCSDGDEAGVAQDAVASGEVSSLLEDAVALGGLSGVFDSSDFGVLGFWSEMCSTFFLRMSRAAWSERMGVSLCGLSIVRRDFHVHRMGCCIHD